MTPRFGRENLGISQQPHSSFASPFSFSQASVPPLASSLPSVPVHEGNRVLSGDIIVLCWGPGKNPRVTHSPLLPTRPTSDCPLKHCLLVHSAVNTAFVLVSCSSQAYDREQVRPEGYSNCRVICGKNPRRFTDSRLLPTLPTSNIVHWCIVLLTSHLFSSLVIL
jgi:hypothetical protein